MTLLVASVGLFGIQQSSYLTYCQRNAGFWPLVYGLTGRGCT